ncbi:Peptidase family M28 [Thermoactinomyces sp. DSM 45891]|nr:Peptidase family M28 [Thermoactinomyces sp. DSM 45891]
MKENVYTVEAHKAGAVGIIISGGGKKGVRHSYIDPIPAITMEDSLDLENALKKDKNVQVTLKTKTELRKTYSQNIIATLKAQKGAKNPKTYILGAHYDGVDNPAANDNASGTATMMEIAKQLSKKIEP